MTAITRRGALIGAGAVVVAGVPVMTLANADPEIEALFVQLRAANALYDDNCAKYNAATALIPDYPTEIGVSQATMAAYKRQYEACGSKALAEQGEPLLDRISDIQAQITQAPAMTLRGALSKARILWGITALHEGVDETDPDLDCFPRLDDPQFIWSMLQDLERLAGEARS